MKRLETAGLVEATAYRHQPPRFDYHWTERGRLLEPVMDAIARLGLAQFPGARLPDGSGRASAS
jgi:DNA-binding HxlR family transcriptional regulator